MNKKPALPPPVLLDGAMGTLLWERGFRRDRLPCLASLKASTLVTGIHEDYLKAGSQFLLANTFGANSLSFSYGAMKAINTEAVRLAKAAAFSKAHVGASIAPVGAGLPKKPKKSQAVQYYIEQMTILQDERPDALVFETFIRPEDIETAMEAARKSARIPMVFSISMASERSLKKSLAALKKQKLPPSLIALGVNCTTPAQALKAAKGLKKISSLPLWIKPNAGLPNKKGKYSLNAVKFAAQAKKLAQAGAQYLGGCCGTTPEYIARLKKQF